MSEENKQDVVASESEASPKLPTGEVGQETNSEGFTNPTAVKEVELDNEMKNWFVNYVGKKYEPEGGVVTVELAIRAMAEEFPEFLMVLAEENWVRGYQQGVNDSEEGVRLALEQAGVDPQSVTAIPSDLEDVSKPEDE